jgi:hypothetical protein
MRWVDVVAKLLLWLASRRKLNFVSALFDPENEESFGW